jgi:hypothetical protein
MVRSYQKLQCHRKKLEVTLDASHADASCNWDLRAAACFPPKRALPISLVTRPAAADPVHL